MRKIITCLAHCMLVLAGTQAMAQGPAREPPAANDQEQLEVRLEPRGGKTQYTLGEPIVLDLLLSAHVPGYSVNTNQGFSQQVNVTPAAGWLRAHGVDHFDVLQFAGLGEKPLRMQVLLNPAVAFQQAGRYEVSVTTHIRHQAQSDRLLERTSNVVSIELRLPDEAQETEQVALLLAQIKRASGPKKIASAAQRLAFLGGDAAIHAKVGLLALPSCDCRDVTREMMDGLASSRNLPLQLALLHAAWLNTQETPSTELLTAMHDTRAYMRGEMIPGWQMVLEKRTDAAALQAEQEDGQNIDELVSSLPSRMGLNRTQVVYSLMMLNQLTEGQIARVRPYVLKDFSKMDPLQQSMLMSSRRWKFLADPVLIPALRNTLAQEPADLVGYGEAIQRLIELSPDTARPFVVRETCDPKSRTPGKTMVGLPDKALPDVDSCLAQMLRQWQGEPFLRTVKADALARYGSAAALPAIRELYANRSAAPDYFETQYQGALLAYLLRYSPDEALASIRAFAGDLGTLFFPIGNAYSARREAYPAVLQSWLQEQATSGTPQGKRWASSELARGQVSVN